MYSLLESLPSTWKTLMDFLALGFGLAQLWLLEPYQVWTNGSMIFLCLSVFHLSFCIPNKYICILKKQMIMKVLILLESYFLSLRIILFIWNIELHREKHSEREFSTCCFIHSKWLQLLGLGQVKPGARSFLLPVTNMGARAQASRPSPSAFTDNEQDIGLELEQLGLNWCPYGMPTLHVVMLLMKPQPQSHESYLQWHSSIYMNKFCLYASLCSTLVLLIIY